MTTRLSALAQRLEEWTHTKTGRWPSCSMDDDFNEAAAALREAEALLRDWRATELDSMDEEYGPWLEQFTARVDALLSATSRND